MIRIEYGLLFLITTTQKKYMNQMMGSMDNISGTNLPSLPVNCIVYQGGANDDLYIGTDVGYTTKIIT